MKTDATNLTASGLVAIAAVLSWVFVVRYSRRPWHKTREGRHLMGLTLIIAIFTSLATEVRIFGLYPGSAFVAAVLYFLLVVLIGQQNWLLSTADDAWDKENERQRDQDAAP